MAKIPLDKVFDKLGLHKAKSAEEVHKVAEELRKEHGQMGLEQRMKEIQEYKDRRAAEKKKGKK